MALTDDRPKNMEDLPGTRQARGKNKLCLVVGMECMDPRCTDPPEPPEYWVPVQYAIAKTKREAILWVLKNPAKAWDMKRYIDECRGESVNPMWCLWVQYLAVIGNEDTLEMAMDKWIDLRSRD